MSNYNYDLKFKRHEPGKCSKCGKDCEELFTAVVSLGNKSHSFVLCKDCSISLKYGIDKKNAENGFVMHPSVNQSSQATDIETINSDYSHVSCNDSHHTEKNNFSKSNKIIKMMPFVILLCVSAIFLIAIILNSTSKPSSSNNKPYTTVKPKVVEFNEDEAIETSTHSLNKTLTNLIYPDHDCFRFGFYQFNEGLSWIKIGYAQSNKKDIAAINENGDTICLIDPNEYNFDNEVNVTPFKNGFSCVYPTSGADGTWVDKGVLVVNKDGTIVKWLADYEFYDVADDGTIFVQKNFLDFSTNYWELFMFDKNGNIKSTGIKVDNEIYRQNDKGLKITNQIYYFYNDQHSYNDNIIIDIGNKRLFCNSGTQFCFENMIGNDLYLSDRNNYYSCSKSNFAEIVSSANEAEDIYNGICSCTVIDPNFGNEDYSLISISDVYGISAVYKYRYSNSREYIYTDFSGNILGKYADDNNIFYSFGYSDGYFNTIEKGADGKMYLSAYNTNFERIYQPVLFPGSFDSFIYYNKYEAYSGYFFLNTDSTIVLYDRTGNPIHLGDKFMDLSNTSFFVGKNVVISNGWIFCNGTFATLDGTEQIKEVSISCDLKEF